MRQVRAQDCSSRPPSSSGCSLRRCAAAGTSPRCSSRTATPPRPCSTTVGWRNCRRATDRGAGIRVVVGETTGYAHTADLSEDGLLAAAEAAAAVARQGGAGRVVALEQRHAQRRNDVVKLPEEVPKSRKIELLVQADEAAHASGNAISQVSASYGDGRRRIQVANSDGVVVADDQVRTRFSVSCVAVGDTGMQTGYESTRSRWDSSCSTPSTSGKSPAPRTPPSARQAHGTSGAERRGPAHLGIGQRWHPLPRGVRPWPRGGPHRQGRVGLRRAGGRAGGQPARHAGRRRHHRTGVGQLRRRRRGESAPAQRAHRERRAHRLHVGLPAGAQGEPGVLGQRPASRPATCPWSG